jgi:hypothetical protein
LFLEKEEKVQRIKQLTNNNLQILERIKESFLSFETKTTLLQNVIFEEGIVDVLYRNLDQIFKIELNSYGEQKGIILKLISSTFKV